MQSIDYTITSCTPLGEQAIDNICSLNQNSYWESSDDSATLELTFPKDTITDFTLSTFTSVNFVLIGWDSSNKEYNILESSLIISGGKRQQCFPISVKTELSKLQLQISTQDNSRLRIYSLVIKTSREKHIENQKTSHGKIINTPAGFLE